MLFFFFSIFVQNKNEQMGIRKQQALLLCEQMETKWLATAWYTFLLGIWYCPLLSEAASLVTIFFFFAIFSISWHVEIACLPVPGCPFLQAKHAPCLQYFFARHAIGISSWWVLDLLKVTFQVRSSTEHPFQKQPLIKLGADHHSSLTVSLPPLRYHSLI